MMGWPHPWLQYDCILINALWGSINYEITLMDGSFFGKAEWYKTKRNTQTAYDSLIYYAYLMIIVKMFDINLIL